MGEVVPAHTLPTLHPPSPPTVHKLLRLALQQLTRAFNNNINTVTGSQLTTERSTIFTLPQYSFIPVLRNQVLKASLVLNIPCKFRMFQHTIIKIRFLLVHYDPTLSKVTLLQK